MYWGGHLHLNPPIVFMHVPPFWHGFCLSGEHSLTSAHNWSLVLEENKLIVCRDVFHRTRDAVATFFNFRKTILWWKLVLFSLDWSQRFPPYFQNMFHKLSFKVVMNNLTIQVKKHYKTIFIDLKCCNCSKWANAINGFVVLCFARWFRKRHRIATKPPAIISWFVKGMSVTFIIRHGSFWIIVLQKNKRINIENQFFVWLSKDDMRS